MLAEIYGSGELRNKFNDMDWHLLLHVFQSTSNSSANGDFLETSPWFK